MSRRGSTRTTTELIGATRLAQEGAHHANAGEFAAHWNELHPDDRQRWWEYLHESGRISTDLMMRRLFVTAQPPETPVEELERRLRYLVRLAQLKLDAVMLDPQERRAQELGAELDYLIQEMRAHE